MRAASFSLLGLLCVSAAACDSPTGPNAGGPEAGIEIDVDSLSLVMGDTVWVTATVRDEGGSIVPEIVTWRTATGGLELPSGTTGVRVRPVEVGNFKLIAETADGFADTIPVRVTPITAELRTVAAGTHSCGLDDEGQAYCWGFVFMGRYPPGGAYAASIAAPAPVPGGQAFEQIVVGHQHACGLSTDGTPYCWGLADNAELGGVFGSTEPVEIAGAPAFVTLASGGWHICGLTAGGIAHCWGSNGYAQLGDGTTVDRSTPVPVQGGHTFASLNASGWNTCGMTAAGEAHCWGWNGRGQLGHASEETCSDPVHGQVPCTLAPRAAASTVPLVEIAAGGVHSCGITASGKAYCWGDGRRGQLGDGSRASSQEPVPVAQGFSYAEIEAGVNYACGRSSAGEVECWGQNSHGNTGEEPGTQCQEENYLFRCSPEPVRVGDGVLFSTLTVGSFHACGMIAERARCWGSNGSGALGIGSFSPSRSATPLAVRDGGA